MEDTFSLLGKYVGTGDGRRDVLPTTFGHPLENHPLRHCRQLRLQVVAPL